MPFCQSVDGDAIGSAEGDQRGKRLRGAAGAPRTILVSPSGCGRGASVDGVANLPELLTDVACLSTQTAAKVRTLKYILIRDAIVPRTSRVATLMFTARKPAHGEPGRGTSCPEHWRLRRS